jgi:hypothetical protein
MTIQDFINSDTAKIEEIIEKYPKQIPVPVLADVLGTNEASLRAAIDGGALGLSWRKDGKLNRGYCVPTAKFVYWWFGQNPIRDIK